MYRIKLNNGVTVETNDMTEVISIAQALDRTISIFPGTMKKMEEVIQEETRQKRVYRKRATRKTGGWKKWKGEEIDLIANNITKSPRELKQVLVGRSFQAIRGIQYQLKTCKLSAGRQKTYDKFLGFNN